VVLVALERMPTMKTPTQNFYATLSTLLWSTVFLVSPPGLAQTPNEVLSLNGSSAYVSIPNSPDLENPTEITVEAWLYPADTGNFGYFFMKGDAGFADSARSYELKWLPGTGNNNLEFSVFLGASTWADVGAPAPAGRWVHFAGTYSSADSTLKIYINGVLIGATITDASGNNLLNHQQVRQTTLPLVFGAELTHPLGFAAGQMDEVRIWNKARTQAEIAGSFSCRLTGTESNLVAYYNFDGGSANDLTGHGHNGTLAGGAAIVPLSGADVIHAGCGNPVLDIQVSQVNICWDTASDKWYQLRYRSDLPANQWVNLGGLLLGTGSKICITDDVADAPRRFYRAVVAP
jgi:Concanavalin A-like lectin/glucanases superfamily